MTPEQLHQIDQARRYAEQDEYVVTRTHIRNLLAIIEAQAASVPSDTLEVRLSTGLLAIAQRMPLTQAFTSRANEPSRYAEHCWRELSATLAAAPEYMPIC